jgi:hypothetical protein
LPIGSYIVYADNYFGGNYEVMKWLNNAGRSFVILSRSDRSSDFFNKITIDVIDMKNLHINSQSKCKLKKSRKWLDLIFLFYHGEILKLSIIYQLSFFT